MTAFTIKILTSLIIIFSLLLVKYFISKALKNVQEKYGLNEKRSDQVKRVIRFAVFFLVGLILLGLWEINPEDLALYFASVFTIIGVAFFAQWSHLSNVTGAIILYFAHSIKIGDEIEIMDKESAITGVIKEINLFFIHILTKEGQQITLSNTLFLQKIIGYKIKSHVGY